MIPDAFKEYRGPLAWMAKNPVASNLLMFVILVAGLVGVFQIKQEVFPEFDLDYVVVSVPYPGASPAEVEQGIVLAVEEAVRGIDGVKQVNSISSEGVGVVTIEMLGGADLDKALADVKSEVDRIQTFPEDAERPVASLIAHKREVASLLIAGDQPLSTLHAIAEQAREKLLAHENITQVEVEGVPPLEVSIEISRENLEAYGITLNEAARQIAAASLELPGGKIDTKAGQVLVRMADRKKHGYEFADIIIRGTQDGAKVRLGEIAEITDGYEDTDQASYFNGQRAVRLTVYRIGEETPTEVARAAREVMATLTESLPANISLMTWNDRSQVLEQRIDLLTRNAAIGLLLVMISLALFLKIRFAFWVAVGIPVTFLGSFIVLNAMGQSINMISLFALIIALGMVVDDAIIVAENTFSKVQQGMPRTQAAIEGVHEMAMPVTFSVLTTITAFIPLMFIPGVMGKIFFIIPVVVSSILLFSLVEVFFVLPSHLAHGKRTPRGKTLQWVERRRLAVAGWLQKFIDRLYKPFLIRVIDRRYLTLSLALAVLCIVAGVAISGILPFNFFPDIEDNEVDVTARLAYGAPIEKNREVQTLLEEAAFKAAEELGGADIFKGMFTRIGEQRGGMSGSGETGSHLIDIEIGLLGTEEGLVRARDFADAWRKHLPPIVGLESLVFNVNAGPSAGSAVDVQLTHTDTEVLAAASAEVAEALAGYQELDSVENAYAAGKPQFDYHLLPAARTLGLTARDVAGQIRSAFYGAESIREQRGRNEVRVMVRLSENQRRSEYDLNELRIFTPAAGMVPLSHVATFERKRAPTNIRRENGKRVVNVKAKMAVGVPSPRPIIESINKELVPKLLEKYNGLAIEFAGRQREQNESFASLIQYFLLAMFVIFALMAIPLRSYVQPLVIMSAIPFGIIAAIFGHILMFTNLSLLSVMGMVALAGVVVNDTLVLVVTANRNREEKGMGVREAIISAGTRRFRPILLTSLTTFLGLAPMIFETSVQAKFMVPMAISLGFGILLSLPVVLLITPAIYLIVEDIINFAGRGQPIDSAYDAESVGKH